MTVMVRIDERLHEALKAASTAEKRPIGQILSDAFAQYQRDEFWKGVKQDYTRLRNNPVEWELWQRETELLDSGSVDSLLEEEPYYTAEEIEEIKATRG